MRSRLHISKGPLSLGVPVIFHSKLTLVIQFLGLLIFSNILLFCIQLGQHGFSNILLSDYLRRPICSVPSRTTAFRCHYFSAGGNAIEPAVKAVTVVLTK